MRATGCPRLTLSAEIALEQGQPQEALRILESLRHEAGLHTAALRLELHATQAASRFAGIPPLVEQLVKRGVFDVAQGEQLRIAALREQLRALAHDASGLRDTWNRLPESTRTQAQIARAAALSFLQLGGDREAAARIHELTHVARQVRVGRMDIKKGIANLQSGPWSGPGFNGS